MSDLRNGLLDALVLAHDLEAAVDRLEEIVSRSAIAAGAAGDLASLAGELGARLGRITGKVEALSLEGVPSGV